MRRAATFLVLALIAVSRGGPIGAAGSSRVEGRPDDITPATVAAVERWAGAVRNHMPGHRDAELEMVSALTFEKRRELDPGMQFFLNALQGKPEVIKTTAETELVSLAAGIRQTTGADAFLKRAAVLHSDTAFNREVDGDQSMEPAVRAPSGLPYSALLSQHHLFVSRDGEVISDTISDWNWPFARSLLALLSPRAPGDPFVGAWYHTTSAFMFQRGLYGELILHLQSAASVLPDDARVLFDRACYAESQGLPRNQVLLSDQDVAAARTARHAAISRSNGRECSRGHGIIDFARRPVARDSAWGRQIGKVHSGEMGYISFRRHR